MALSTLIWNYFLEVNTGSYQLEARAWTLEWLSLHVTVEVTEKEGTCTGWAGAISN